MGLVLGRFPSPLRYPGGKGKIANYLKRVIIVNKLQGGEYIEPYAGGAAAALHLLFEDFVDQIHINDLDPGIAAFWQSALEETEDLIDLIRTARLSMREWERQRIIQQDENASTLLLGFATFYMNRTNRSGIVGGGPIGGRSQSGRWGIDARFNRQDLIRRIEKIARFGTRISITRRDAANVIEDWHSKKAGRYLLYADPPYYRQGGQLYLHHYSDDDHARVSELIRGLSIPWIVSYDNVPQIRSMYEGSRMIDYSLSYSAASRYRGDEVMFVSPGLSLPDVTSPANLPLPEGYSFAT